MVDFRQVKMAVYACAISSFFLVLTSAGPYNTTEGTAIRLPDGGGDRRVCTTLVEKTLPSLNHTGVALLYCNVNSECTGFDCSAKLSRRITLPPNVLNVLSHIQFGVEINRYSEPVELKFYVQLGSRPCFNHTTYKSELVRLPAAHFDYLGPWDGFLDIKRYYVLEHNTKYMKVSVSLQIHHNHHRVKLLEHVIIPPTLIPIRACGGNCTIDTHSVPPPPIKHSVNRLCAHARMYRQAVEELVVGRCEVHELQLTARGMPSDSCKIRFRAAESHDLLHLVTDEYQMSLHDRLRIFDESHNYRPSRRDWRREFESSGRYVTVEYISGHFRSRHRTSNRFQLTITTRQCSSRVPEPHHCPSGYNHCSRANVCLHKRIWCQSLRKCGMDYASNRQSCYTVFQEIEKEKKAEAHASMMRKLALGIGIACSMAVLVLCASCFGILFCKNTFKMPTPPDPHAIWRGGRWEEMMKRHNTNRDSQEPLTDGEVKVGFGDPEQTKLGFGDPEQTKPDIVTDSVEKKSMEC